MICANCQREIAEQSNFCYYCGARQQPAPRPPAATSKRLKRSATNSKIAGVCGGLGEYADLDPTIVRLVWVFVSFFTGIFPGIVVYFLAWIIMPKATLPAVAQAAPATQVPQSS